LGRDKDVSGFLVPWVKLYERELRIKCNKELMFEILVVKCTVRL